MLVVSQRHAPITKLVKSWQRGVRVLGILDLPQSFFSVFFF